MAAISFASNPAQFADPFATDWTDHPQKGPLNVPRVVSMGLQAHLYDVNGTAVIVAKELAASVLSQANKQR